MLKVSYWIENSNQGPIRFEVVSRLDVQRLIAALNAFWQNDWISVSIYSDPKIGYVIFNYDSEDTYNACGIREHIERLPA